MDKATVLERLRDNIVNVQEYVGSMDFAGYLADDLAHAATEFRLIRVSDAAASLGDSACALCPSIDWTQLRGLGDHLHHEYDSIDEAKVWKIIQEDLPRLKAAVEAVLASDKLI